MGSFTLPVRYRGQQKTCKVCEATDHMARDCPYRGRCFVCGSYQHQAAWHEKNTTDVLDEGSDGERTDNMEATPVIVVENPNIYPEEEISGAEVEEETEEEDKSKKDQSGHQEKSRKPEERKEEGEKHDQTEETKTTGPKQAKKTLNNQPDTEVPEPRATTSKQPTSQHKSSDVKEKTKPKPKPRLRGFWDEATKKESTRKRKIRESEINENDDDQRKLAKDELHETSDMEEDKFSDEEQEEKTPKDDEPIPESDEDDDEFVTYFRGGVERRRKKRISWMRRPEESSQPDKSIQHSQRGRGRGRTT